MRVDVAIRLKKALKSEEKAINIEKALMKYCIDKGKFLSDKECPNLVSAYESERNKFFSKLLKYPTVFSDKKCLTELSELKSVDDTVIDVILNIKDFTLAENGLNMIYRHLMAYSDVRGKQEMAMALLGLVSAKDYCRQLTTLARMIDKKGEIYSKFGPRLLEHFVKGEKIDLAYPEAIFPEIFEKEHKKIQNQLEQKIVEKSTDLYQCPQCHQRKSKSHSQQNRSLDEEATIVCECLNCGKIFHGH
jgi:DNA-directed RNA polymerase subunit M/transcription elongation factor TFIIS